MEEFADAFGRLGIVRRQARAFFASGRMRATKYSWDQAIADYGKALEAWRRTQDRTGEGGALNNLGGVHYSISQYEKAVDYWAQALALMRVVQDRAQVGTGAEQPRRRLRGHEPIRKGDRLPRAGAHDPP